MESRNMILTNLFAGQYWRCRRREQIYGHSVAGEGGGEMNGQGSMETHTLPYVK